MLGKWVVWGQGQFPLLGSPCPFVETPHSAFVDLEKEETMYHFLFPGTMWRRTLPLTRAVPVGGWRLGSQTAALRGPALTHSCLSRNATRTPCLVAPARL